MIKLKFLLLPAIVEAITVICASAATDQNEPDVLAFVDNMPGAHQKDVNALKTTLSLVEKSRHTRNSVVRIGLAALPDESGSGEKIALDRGISQINELRIPLPRTPQKTVAPSEQAPSEPDAAEQSQPQSEEQTLLGKIDGRTLEELTALAKEPNNIAEPLALAQMLVNAGYSKEAAIFYEIAACRKTSLGHVLTDDDKAWILLQLAACRNENPETAIGVLNKLIDNYPKSTWASAAAAKRDILEWYQKDKPRSLLEARHE
jgi:tetratricopeptide (TPR) repeat protein